MSATATQGHGHVHAHEGGADGTYLYHHFDDLEQQHFSSMLGMWAFLATEVLFFGGLFLAYAVYRNLYHASFVAAGQHLNVPLGGVNTAVLLVSSLTMALAVRSSQLRQTKMVLIFLGCTAVLGTAFLGIKASEWITDYHEHLVPGIDFDWAKAEASRRAHEGGEDVEAPEGRTPREGEVDVAAGKSVAAAASFERVEADTVLPLVSPTGQKLRPVPGSATEVREMSATTDAGRAQLFFVIYFCMTGLHALHMVIGLGVVGVLAAMLWRGRLSGGGSTQVEVVGLYWHFVDIVWVFLYPILYLIDIHQ